MAVVKTEHSSYSHDYGYYTSVKGTISQEILYIVPKDDDEEEYIDIDWTTLGVGSLGYWLGLIGVDLSN